MNNLIKLHNSNNNTPIIVNINEICFVSTLIENDKRYSYIYHYNDLDFPSFSVNESVDKIETLLPKDSFVKLHKEDDNTTTLLNNNFISIIDSSYKNQNKSYSTIYVNFKRKTRKLYVNERPEKIYEMIEK